MRLGGDPLWKQATPWTEQDTDGTVLWQDSAQRRVADICAPEVRSALMSRIRAKNTSPELALRRALHQRGLRYRLNVRGLPGTPDIVFASTRIAVFVHGCFWHGCPEHYTAPKNRAAFWQAKITATRERDARARASLADLGWLVIEFWEHEIESGVEDCAASVASAVARLRELS